LVPAAVLLGLGLVDVIRTRRPVAAIALALPVLQAEVAVFQLAHLSAGATGLALCVAACVWCGLGLLVDAEWNLPLFAAGGLSVLTGVCFAANDPTMFGATLVIAGGLTIGAAAHTRIRPLFHVGALLAMVGGWTELAAGHVQATDLYIAPIALYLLALGVHLRHRPDDGTRPNSWVAYGLPIAALGATAIVETLRGGGAGHALLAGAVGVTAVAIGGWRRLSAPLLLGTGIVVALTVVETLSSAAGVPLSAWLAAGGALLLGTAVMIERTDTSPIEAGRRVVDVLAEHFD
jgi:hypothetical protein